MSKPKVFEKPTGVKDYLPEAAAKLRSIEFKLMQCLERWGYREIIINVGVLRYRRGSELDGR